MRLDPRLRSTPLDGAIPTIPYSAIAAFLSRPTIMSEDEDQARPVRGRLPRRCTSWPARTTRPTSATSRRSQNSRYAVVHIAGPLRDPDDNSAPRLRGDLHRDRAGAASRGSGQGGADRSGARDAARATGCCQPRDTADPAELHPACPARPRSKGRIIDVVGGTELVGQYAVIVINRGRSQGIEPGSVLAIDQGRRHRGRPVSRRAQHRLEHRQPPSPRR